MCVEEVRSYYFQWCRSRYAYDRSPTCPSPLLLGAAVPVPGLSCVPSSGGRRHRLLRARLRRSRGHSAGVGTRRDARACTFHFQRSVSRSASDALAGTFCHMAPGTGPFSFFGRSGLFGRRWFFSWAATSVGSDSL